MECARGYNGFMLLRLGLPLLTLLHSLNVWAETPREGDIINDVLIQGLHHVLDKKPVEKSAGGIEMECHLAHGVPGIACPSLAFAAQSQGTSTPAEFRGEGKFIFRELHPDRRYRLTLTSTKYELVRAPTHLIPGKPVRVEVKTKASP